MIFKFFENNTPVITHILLLTACYFELSTHPLIVFEEFKNAVPPHPWCEAVGIINISFNYFRKCIEFV